MKTKFVIVAVGLTFIASLGYSDPPVRESKPLAGAPRVAADAGKRPAALPGPRVARLDLCQVNLIDDIDVPAPEAGLLIAIEAEEGTAVEDGKLLARIDDRKELVQKEAAEMERDAAKARAEEDIEVRFAEATHAKAGAELDDVLSVEKRSAGTITRSKVRELELEKERARLQIDKSKLDRKVAKMTADVQQSKVRLADDSIVRRRIESPIDGEVLAVYHAKGEWVNAGESVFRVVRLDRLRVEGFLSAAEFNPSEVACRPVTVEVQLAHGRSVQFTGEVTFVNPEIKAGNKYRVRAEVENRRENGHWLLQPGKEAAMAIGL